jgi:hypothetical protein
MVALPLFFTIGAGFALSEGLAALDLRNEAYQWFAFAMAYVFVSTRLRQMRYRILRSCDYMPSAIPNLKIIQTDQARFPVLLP